MKPRTIGCGGQLANGKDELCDYLVTQLNLSYAYPNNMWVRNAMANPVKQIFQNAFNVDRDFIEKWKREKEPADGFDLPIRECLILIGDGFRKMKSNVWIENCFRNQENDQILADLRYINETNYIRQNGGVTILIWRPGFENSIQNDSEQQFMPFINKLKTMNFDGPIPKKLDIPFDLWIRNDGSMEDLRKKVDNIIMPFVGDFWKMQPNREYVRR